MAKVIMVQGTMSNVGKSLVTAALCRIFKQDGYKVAPFKSQNMALNSYITSNGLEMSRATAMQAFAAKTEPSIYMNPILLKPTTDVGSQVIINGKVYDNMKARDYFKIKKNLMPHIKNAYDKLAEEYDIIVIEGAGSPVELNLKSDDIVNMGIAKMFNAPVLLVGDIDRGGVFAQLIGTLDLLEKDEKDLVAGLIVNKFRGDKSLFNDGVAILEEKGNIPVVGVLPYVDVDIEEEDSLSDKLYTNTVGEIDICVIKLPKISNYTDIDNLRRYKEIGVRYATKSNEIGQPDMIIIPGSKSTIEDMRWLSQNGMDKAILECASNGTKVFGICGGFQMMGRRIEDKEHLETSQVDSIEGLGIFDMITSFESNKIQKNTSEILDVKKGFYKCIDGQIMEGYEIHMGRSSIKKSNESPDIYDIISADGRIIAAYNNSSFGTYIHGVFDNDKIVRNIILELAKTKGIDITSLKENKDEDKNESYKEYRDRQFDILADAVRKNIDLKAIYKIIGV